LNSPSETAGDIARWHNPDEFPRSLRRRPESELPFDIAALQADSPVMLDTNFYIQQMKGRVPRIVVEFVKSRVKIHSSVACAELTVSIGILDPSHPKTAENRKEILAVLDSIYSAAVVAPSGAAWIEAAMIAGILARIQHLAKPKKEMTAVEACCQEGLRRKLLNDALIFLSACEQNAVLVSTNSKDMDLLLRFRPAANVLLFN
jgi:predicted nucleic acid-binding protein